MSFWVWALSGDRERVPRESRAAKLPASTDPTSGRKKLHQSRNTLKLPIEQYAHQLLAVDLSNIPGFGRDALLTFIAEVGESITKFHSANAFAKWLGFTPNNKASGGKNTIAKDLEEQINLTQYVSDGG